MVDIKKYFGNISHDKILKQYFFPKNYKFLLIRWLTPNILDKSQHLKNLGKVKRGILQSFILSSSIASLMLFNVFSDKMFKEKNKNRSKI